MIAVGLINAAPNLGGSQHLHRVITHLERVFQFIYLREFVKMFSERSRFNFYKNICLLNGSFLFAKSLPRKSRFTEENIQELVLRKNATYGGLNPSITNVVFTHGQLDPWRALGVQKSLNKDAIAIVIPGMV